MIYDVTLKIACDYPAAVKDARHVLRVRLREDAEQSILAQSVRVAPKPDELLAERDFFGNGVDHLTLRQPHEALTVELRARVRTIERRLDLSQTPALAALGEAAALVRYAGASSPLHFLGESRMLPDLAGAGAYARGRLGRADTAPGAGEAVLALTRGIRQDFTYAPGSTRIDTPLGEVLASRRGVCQDFAHLMIAGLRGVGVPAAYVSGFIRTDPPPGRPHLEGADAMHAWVSVWLGADLGWVGFDPTNGAATGPDHIKVAVGRDYADVAPIGGVFVTSGPQRTRHAVDVVPVEEAAVAEALGIA